MARFPFLAVAVAAMLPIWGCDPIQAPHVSRSTILISSTPSGGLGTGNCDYSWISDNGERIVFRSNSSNFVVDQGEPSNHIYVKNRKDNTFELATRNSDSGDIPVFCFPVEPFISANGRFVVFGAFASLDNGFYAPSMGYNIFIRDLDLKITRRAIDRTTWPPANCYHSVISDDGRFVAYQMGFQIYLSDTSTNPPTIYLVSHAPGAPATGSNAACEAPWISADGRTICFSSQGSNLSPDDPDALWDVYVATFNAGVVSNPKLVSRNSGVAGTKSNADCRYAHLSPDGLFVTFSSAATNLGAVGLANVFVRDLTTDQTTCVTVTADGLGPNQGCFKPRITRGGTRVVFMSRSTNLSSQVNGGGNQPYITLPGGGFELVGINDGGLFANDGSWDDYASISSVGHWIVWPTQADNLVDDDNGMVDIYGRGPYP